MHALPYLRRLLALGLGVGLLLLLLDLALAAAVRAGGLLDEPIDLQSPTALFARLDHLRRFPGFKVVVLGDSVAYGRCMQEHGDAQWRQHTLSALLEAKFRQAFPDRPVLVMNLGINGALPADLERLAELLRPCAPDLLIFDVGLRSFSADFAESVLSRPWLKQIALDAKGGYREENEAIRTFLANHWELYRLRDLLQAHLFDGPPRTYLQGLRDRANRAVLGQGTADHSAESEDDLLLALQISARFQSVSFQPANPQRQALERLLTSLENSAQKTLVFYAKENPARISSILSEEQHRQLSDELQMILRHHASTHVAFLPPVAALEPAHFLDLMHLNHAGHAILAEHVWAELGRFLPATRREGGTPCPR